MKRVAGLIQICLSFFFFFFSSVGFVWPLGIDVILCLLSLPKESTDGLGPRVQVLFSLRDFLPDKLFIG
jgi:hypothetical protein